MKEIWEIGYRLVLVLLAIAGLCWLGGCFHAGRDMIDTRECEDRIVEFTNQMLLGICPDDYHEFIEEFMKAKREGEI